VRRATAPPRSPMPPRRRRARPRARSSGRCATPSRPNPTPPWSSRWGWAGCSAACTGPFDASPAYRHHLAAVGDDGCPGDEAAGVGDEQQQRAVEIALHAEAAHRNIALDGLAFLTHQIIAIELGDDPAGRNGVDANALEGEFERQRL